jgi:FAD/FMN-containing dehydrogenase
MGKYGLAADNLLSVELVTSSGEVVTASEGEHPDLFWALRGGGGNFGVASSFQYRLHPLGQVFGGLVAHPFDAAGEVLRFYRDFIATAPDELAVLGALVHAPDGSGVPLAAFVICHAGSLERAQSDLEPLLKFGSPAMVQVGPMPYPAANMMLDDAYPRGALNYWKSNFVQDLSDEAIETMIDRFAACPSPMGAMVIEHFHGAVTRVDVSETPVPHREPGYNFLVTAEWMELGATGDNIDWARQTYAALQPYLLQRRWLNYFDDDEASDAVRAAYGPNYERLARVKAKYDPDNLFRLNHNVTPAAA